MGPADDNDHRLATDLAREAGGLLLEIRAQLAGAPAAQRGDEGDRRSAELIARRLAEARPGDALLMEGTVDDLRRVGRRRVWIVDPLDGTREFGDDGRVDWAVHVALWEAGRLAAGAVALPAVGRLLAAEPPPPPPAPAGGRPRIAVSRTRPPAVVDLLAERLGAEVVPLGSAGYKAMAVVTGEVDAYVHAGGQHEWDSAAPAAVVTAAGLHASRLDGSPLAYNRPDAYLPDLVFCRRELAAVIISAASGS